MAVFSHDNRTISYQLEPAPFAHDLVLLQGSRFTMDFWRPVLENLSELPKRNGRILLCDWYNHDRDEAQLALDLNGLVKTLGLHTIHTVACDDAVEVVAEYQKMHAGRFDKTLLFARNVPRPEDLNRAIREFSQI